MARGMKESGVEWIGEIPENWKLLPARHAFSEIKEKNTDGTVTKALQFKMGTIISKKNFTADSDEYVADTILNYTIVEPNTIMINGLNLNYDFISKRVAIVRERGVITSAYLALKPDESKIFPDYAMYLFKGYEAKMAFHNMGAGIRLTLGFKEFKHQPVLFPPLAEQSRIAAYLDTRCAYIDAVMEKTRASVEEYRKLRQALITQAVTKGIRGDSAMKDSGIEWIGEIPAEWEVRRFKSLATVKSNLVSPEAYEDYIQVSPENIEKDTGKLSACRTVKDVGVISGNHLFSKGQILYSKIRPKLNKVTIAPFDGLCSADMYPIETSQNIQFFLYTMLSDVLLAQVSLITEDRVKMPKINQEELGDTVFAIPPISEQEEIAAYLNEKCAEIDSLISKKETFLTELENYKKSLIYEYVTGKKEVPTA